jgi:hypothetical protein
MCGLRGYRRARSHLQSPSPEQAGGLVLIGQLPKLPLSAFAFGDREKEEACSDAQSRDPVFPLLPVNQEASGKEE